VALSIRQKYCNKYKKITDRNLYCNIFLAGSLSELQKLINLLSAQNKIYLVAAVITSRAHKARHIVFRQVLLSRVTRGKATLS